MFEGKEFEENSRQYAKWRAMPLNDEEVKDAEL